MQEPIQWHKDRATAAERERCIRAVKSCPSLDENGYICEKSEAIKAILGTSEQPTQESRK